MRASAMACCLALVLTVIFAAMAEEAPSTSAKGTFRFFLHGDESNDRLVAVPVAENEKPPNDGTLVTCESLRFERNGIVFVNVTMESEESRVTAAEMTARLDKVSGAEVSWDVSDDFKMEFKTAEAKRRFLERHMR